MIKKGITLILFWGIFSSAYGQADQIKKDKQITIEDLKPKINYASSDPFYQPLREKSGLALVSSAIIPGSGQAANGKWLRAGAYLLVEAVAMTIHFKSYNDAKREQRQYERFADNNWSVVTYAKWLVNYHDQNPELSNPHIDELRNQVADKSAAYNPQEDWNKVDLELLRKVERETRFVYPNEIGNPFSHQMPDFGSQQYYELISKYYQYGPGWNDFDNNKYQLNWDGSDMPANFITGSSLAEDFNDSYQLAGNMVSLIILNHIVSAFDAFLTVKVKNNRLETTSNLLNPSKTVSFKYHF